MARAGRSTEARGSQYLDECFDLSAADDESASDKPYAVVALRNGNRPVILHKWLSFDAACGAAQAIERSPTSFQRVRIVPQF